MMEVTVSYEQTGRVSQKARTRAALVNATRSLLAAGTTPTIERVAAAASVSRTTAYRYFPDVQALLVAAYPQLERQSLLGDDPPEDPAERLEIVVAGQLGRILAREAEMRAVLRLSLDGIRPPELPMHRGLRLAWVEDALSPLAGRLGPERHRRLVHGIAAMLGIEAFTWLTDIAGLRREEAVEVIGESARARLAAELAWLSEAAGG